jgi:tight adherence protein B
MRWFFLFFAFLVLYGAVAVVWWNLGKEKRRQQLVRNLTSHVNPEGTVRTTVLMEEPSRSRGLAGMFRSRKPKARVDPTKVARLSKGRFFLVTLAAAAGGFLVGMKCTDLLGFPAPLIGAFVGGMIPKIYRSRNRDKRIALLEEQFPEMLDFLARSVRAGNAFSIALELLAGEAQEPMKSEIVKLTREMALGASLQDALTGLIARVDLLEVRMFVAAVLLQRETGGNLSEVLNKLGTSVRERLRLRGQVIAASGQGRLTAKVLTFLPIATLLLLKLGSPEYIANLTGDPLGRNLLGFAVVSQILGYLVMQKMIKVEV